jgi:DNA-binding LacI/PurR family transcriptional regulator
MSKLDDIAKVAGVSRHTVARILGGKRQEKWASKQEQGDRIRRLAEEMGYRPNASARALVLGKFGCIGLLHSTKDTQSYLSPVMLSAIDDGLVKHDLHLSIARLDDSKLTSVEYVPKILREWLCDGLIINYHGVPPKMKKLITDFKIPAVWLNCRLEHDAVFTDDFAAAVQATEFLAENGHRRIVYADASYFRSRRGGHQHYNKSARKDGYSEVVTKLGQQPMFVYDDEKGVAHHFINNLRELLSGENRPTAVVAYSRIEIRATRIVAAELGLKIPQDLSIIGFKGESDLTPMIWDDTVMMGPEREMCMEAVEMLIRKIARPQVEFPSKIIPFSIHEGDTVAVCRE